MLGKKGEKEKACQLLQTAIAHQGNATHKNPRHPEYATFLCLEYGLLAKLLAEQGKADEAKGVLEQAREQNKNIPEVLNGLAWWMVKEPTPPAGDFDMGLQMAKQAVDKQPENGNYWNTLGVTHYRDGNWQAAITALDKSRELHRGGDSYDFFFLAMAHWQLGDKDQAREWYDKATAALPKTKNEELGRIQDEAARLLEVAGLGGTP